MTIGQRLRGTLVERDMTVKEMSDRSGVKLGALYALLNGERDPRLSTVIRIADALDVSLDWFVGRERNG